LGLLSRINKKSFLRQISPAQQNVERSTYRMELPQEYKIHPVFHAGLLKFPSPNNPTLFPVRETPPPDPVFAEEEEYKIEPILDHRNVRNRAEYMAMLSFSEILRHYPFFSLFIPF